MSARHPRVVDPACLAGLLAHHCTTASMNPAPWASTPPNWRGPAANLDRRASPRSSPGFHNPRCGSQQTPPFALATLGFRFFPETLDGSVKSLFKPHPAVTEDLNHRPTGKHRTKNRPREAASIHRIPPAEMGKVPVPGGANNTREGEARDERVLERSPLVRPPR